MKIQNFLKISNIFEKFEKKKFSFWSKSHFEPLEHYINIPELYLDKQSTAFYISSKNKNLNFNNIWNSIMNNKNSSLFYKTVKNNKENYTANKSEILKKIAFINLSEYDKNNDGLPFIEIWNTCIKSYETIKKHYDLSIFNKDFELTMKNSLFSKITFYSQQLHSVNLSYQKVFDSIFLEYSEKISHNNDVKIIESFASVVYDVVTDYKNVMADHLVRFLKDLKTNHFRLLEEYEKSDFNISKKIIEQNRLALKYMKEINNSSIQQVSIAIKKRDILQEISFYSSYRKKLIKKNVYYIKSIIKKLTGEKKNLKIMLKNLINDDIKWLEVYKNLLIKRKLIKFWKKHIHNVVYLKNNMIFDLENFVDQEVKIFSESRFFPILKSNKDKRYKLSRIRQIINYEFDIPIDFYTSESYKTDKSIEKEMNILLKKKDKIDKLVFVKKDTLNEPSKIFNFEQSIKLAQAEVKWSDESQNKLFSLFLSNKEIKVSRLEKNIKSYKKTVAPLLNYFESVISSHENAKQLLELETVKDIKSFRKLFAFKEWSLNLLINLSRYTSSKSSVSKKLEIDYLAALEFIRLYESLSINIEKMFLPYKKLKLGEKFKLKFVKYHLNGAKFLFVQDDNSISYEEKKKF
ncbi:hypothetical protein NWQ33_02895 [Mycoplasmopsis cynos]|nr:hypothetical protein [Mycoplasmopsis cynos]